MRIVKLLLTIVPIVTISTNCSKFDSNYSILEEKNIICTPESHLEYKPWGESGMQAICILNHGRFAIVEYGHLVMEGQYNQGKKVGEWHWYDKSGRVERTEQYGGTLP